MAGQQPPRTIAGTVPASGFLQLVFTPRANQVVDVTQVGVEMTVNGSTTAAAAIGWIRRNGSPVSPFVPTGDAPAGDPPIRLWPGDQMTVEWTSCPAGLIGTATVFYNVVEG